MLFCTIVYNYAKSRNGYENVGYERLTMSLVHERISSKHLNTDAFTTPADEELRTAIPIHYHAKSAVDSEKFMLEHGGVAKEHDSLERFDVIVKASTLEVPMMIPCSLDRKVQHDKTNKIL